ncbi:hypothetical protein STEG23_016614, partial [Scotinomys teguina]
NKMNQLGLSAFCQELTTSLGSLPVGIHKLISLDLHFIYHSYRVLQYSMPLATFQRGEYDNPKAGSINQNLSPLWSPSGLSKRMFYSDGNTVSPVI